MRASWEPPHSTYSPPHTHQTVPTYESYTSWVLQRLSTPGLGQPIIKQWVDAPWRLVQDPKAPPLRFTPASSAQLQSAILMSSSNLMDIPPQRCQALLASSVTVSFAVRSNLNLDSNTATRALQDAFSRISGGCVPFRISVRVVTPSQLAQLSSSGGNGVVSLSGLGPGSGSGAHRRRLARRILRQQSEQAQQSESGQTDPRREKQSGFFPEKQVMVVTFKDLSPSNATYLADQLAARCGSAPVGGAGCMDDIRRALQVVTRPAADDDGGLRVSMLARPQVRPGGGVTGVMSVDWPVVGLCAKP